MVFENQCALFLCPLRLLLVQKGLKDCSADKSFSSELRSCRGNLSAQLAARQSPHAAHGAVSQPQHAQISPLTFDRKSLLFCFRRSAISCRMTFLFRERGPCHGQGQFQFTVDNFQYGHFFYQRRNFVLCKLGRLVQLILADLLTAAALSTPSLSLLLHLSLQQLQLFFQFLRIDSSACLLAMATRSDCSNAFVAARELSNDAFWCCSSPIRRQALQLSLQRHNLQPLLLALPFPIQAQRSRQPWLPAPPSAHHARHGSPFIGTPQFCNAALQSVAQSPSRSISSLWGVSCFCSIGPSPFCLDCRILLTSC